MSASGGIITGWDGYRWIPEEFRKRGDPLNYDVLEGEALKAYLAGAFDSITTALLISGKVEEAGKATRMEFNPERLEVLLETLVSMLAEVQVAVDLLTQNGAGGPRPN